MAEIGKYNRLKVNRFVDFGAYVDGGDLGEILVPKKYLPDDPEVDQELTLFVYLDSEERYVATTEEVAAQVGEFALMTIVHVNEHGAFADWGLVKNLFVPFREQARPLEIGNKVIVHPYIDKLTNRLVGSTRVMHHLSQSIEGLREKEKVSAIVYRETPKGFLAIIEHRCLGLLYHNQVHQPLHVGQRISPFIKKIREDDKIDLILQSEGYEGVTDFSEKLLQYLHIHGSTPLHDKSAPEDIKAAFGVSKKVFKQAVGNLYKRRLINISKEGLTLTAES